MTPSQLPDRPNLEQLKKQAKTLLHLARENDGAALARFAALPAFAHKPAAELANVGLALHDAQSVIAREHGFDSWNALRDEVEARTLSFDAAVEAFLRSATDGATGGLRVTGLATVYASVFRTWLQDDDPGQARTMAALDRRLRRGERTLRNVEDVGAVLHRLVTDAPGLMRSILRGGARPDGGSGREAGGV